MDKAASVVEQAREASSEDVLARMLNYQKELIEAGDTDCHAIAEALSDSDCAQPDAPSAAPRLQVSPKRWWQFWR